MIPLYYTDPVAYKRTTFRTYLGNPFGVPSYWDVPEYGKCYYGEEATRVKGPAWVPGEYKITPMRVGKGSLKAASNVMETVTCMATVVPNSIQKNYKHESECFAMRYPLSAYSTHLTNNYIDQKAMTLQRALAGVGNSDLSLGVELGEMKETLEFLRNPFTSAKKLALTNLTLFSKTRKILNTPKHMFKRGSDLVKRTADTVLEWDMAVMPLYRSIYDIGEQLKKKQLEFDAKKIRRSTAVSSQEYDNVYDNTFPLTGCDCTYRVTNQGSCKTRAVVYYKCKTERTTLQQLGLSFEYVPEVLWDLARLSFVVGWGLQVKPWLGSFRVMPSISILGNTVSVKEVGIGTAYPKTFYSQVGFEKPVVENVGPSMFQYEAYERLCDEPTPLLPQLRVGNSLSLHQTIDALALIWGPVNSALQNIR
jgi:hypothetical protein